MKEKSKDFLKYVIFVLIQIILSFAYLYIFSRINNNELILIEIIKFIGFSIITNIFFMTALLLILFFERTFQYKIFSWAYSIFSLVLIFDSIKFKESFIGLIGISLLSAGLFSFIVLRKYYKRILFSKMESIEVDFSVTKNGEEIFYKKIEVRTNSTCSDIIRKINKQYLSELNNESTDYNIYFNEKLIASISQDNIKYCDNIDYPLGSFSFEKNFVIKAESVVS